MVRPELDELVVPDAAALRAWLLANHSSSPGVWLALTRKGGTVTSVVWQEAVDEALCAAHRCIPLVRVAARRWIRDVRSRGPWKRDASLTLPRSAGDVPAIRP